MAASIASTVLVPLCIDTMSLFRNSCRAGIFRYIHSNRGEVLNHADKLAISRNNL